MKYSIFSMTLQGNSQSTFWLLIIYQIWTLIRCEIQAVKFKTLSCSNSLAEVILSAPSVVETDQNSLIKCAASCAQSKECNFAVFRQSEKWCKLVFDYNTSSSHPLPGYQGEHQCFVIRKTSSPICQNGGVYTGGSTCSCPQEYTGWECTEPNPAFCFTESTWSELKTVDYPSMQTSNLEIKMILTQDSYITVYPVPFFFSNRFETHNHLVVDPVMEQFEIPLQRDFKLYNTNKLLRTEKIGMTGTRTRKDEEDPNLKLLVRDMIDETRLFYENGHYGNVSYLLEGLSRGYRLLSRDFVRVGVDSVSGDVYYEIPTGNVGASDSSFMYQMYFYAQKFSLKNNGHYVLRQYLHGPYRSVTVGTSQCRWDLDRCWSKDSYGLDYDVIKESVLQGKEIRMIIDGSISTDVMMVTMSNNDIVMALSYYLTPFNAHEGFDANSRIVFPLASLSGKMVECEMDFQGSTVHGITNYTHASMELVMASREWKKVFKVDATGAAIYGSNDVVHAEAERGRNIRVCVENTPVISACFGSLTLSLTAGFHVMLQTPAVARPHFTDEGGFSGFVHSDCKRNVWLLSTKGWVKRASYVLGVEGPADPVEIEAFNTMTWFVQM